MRKAVLAYLVMQVAFLMLDGLWLGVLMGSTYRGLLGPLMLEQPRWLPAILFYLIYGVGVLVFVVLPAAASRSSRRAACLGALLGLVAYGTYDLSNWATLRGWSGQLVLMDLAWGMLVTCLVSLVGYWRMRPMA